MDGPYKRESEFFVMIWVKKTIINDIYRVTKLNTYGVNSVNKIILSYHLK